MGGGVSTRAGEAQEGRSKQQCGLCAVRVCFAGMPHTLMDLFSRIASSYASTEDYALPVRSLPCITFRTTLRHRPAGHDNVVLRASGVNAAEARKV
jgi:hypothetical protein